MQCKSGRSKITNFPSTKNRDTADLAFECKSLIDSTLDSKACSIRVGGEFFRKTWSYSGCLNCLCHDWQMIQSLLNQQSDNPIRIKQKVSSRGLLVPNDGIQGFQLSCLGKREHWRWQRVQMSFIAVWRLRGLGRWRRYRRHLGGTKDCWTTHKIVEHSAVRKLTPSRYFGLWNDHREMIIALSK
jgi:hypothetical protein